MQEFQETGWICSRKRAPFTLVFFLFFSNFLKFTILLLKELEDAKNVAVKSMQEKSWNANITEFQWHVINSCEYMTAVFNLKGLDHKMKEIEFPPDSDKVELAEVLKTEFPDYKSIIKQMVRGCVVHS